MAALPRPTPRRVTDRACATSALSTSRCPRSHSTQTCRVTSHLYLRKWFNSARPTLRPIHAPTEEVIADVVVLTEAPLGAATPESSLPGGRGAWARARPQLLPVRALLSSRLHEATTLQHAGKGPSAPREGARARAYRHWARWRARWRVCCTRAGFLPDGPQHRCRWRPPGDLRCCRDSCELQRTGPVLGP